MPYTIETSQFSFVQFAESDVIEACNFSDSDMCLPVFDENDVWFQFVLKADTTEEADALCDDIDSVSLGIVENCSDGFLVEFAQQPIRYRISDFRVLYVWQHGVPGFDSALDVGKCFHVKVEVSDQSFCSNCFQRIGNDCHTSVIEYGNDENAFGFNYCAGLTDQQSEEDDDCEPTIISFTNKATLVIPWTAFLQNKHGDLPNAQVWVYDETGELVAAGLRVALDQYPPTELRIDFGGVSSGVIKIL